MENEILRINLKDEIKLIKALNKIFKEAEYPIKELPNGDFPFMDASNVSMIICKTEQMRDIFKRFVDSDYFENRNITKIPELDYFENNNGLELKSKYSIDYLSKIINCFNAIDDNPSLKLKNDFPITLEGQQFRFILAPRID